MPGGLPDARFEAEVRRTIAACEEHFVGYLKKLSPVSRPRQGNYTLHSLDFGGGVKY